VVCGELNFYDKNQHVITNPRVIFEVLSPATEVFDRSAKWMRYQAWLPTLTDYVLVSQDMPVIENFHRDEGGSWIYTATKELGSILQLPAISCHLSLAEVYDRVVFPETDDFAEAIAEQE
jgi:Uma2 family endonuclease